MASAMDFRSRPSPCHGVDSLVKKLHHTLSLSTQVYKWVRGHTAGGNLAMDWHTIQGGVAILSVASGYSCSLACVRLYLPLIGNSISCIKKYF